MTSRKADPLTRGEKSKLTRFRKDLLTWFERNGRDFPWRAPTAGTFEQICVEVLLQRTRAETVSKIYPVFFARFTSWADIADASIEELEDCFKPIGLWTRRAHSVKALAEYAAARNGCFPSDPAMLAGVPAVGQYVQNAILLFQHGLEMPLLDVNMARVIERFVRPRRLADIRHDPWLQTAARWLVKGDRAIELNWAVLDFGSAICAARSPKCPACPVYARCRSKGLMTGAVKTVRCAANPSLPSTAARD